MSFLNNSKRPTYGLGQVDPQKIISVTCEVYGSVEIDCDPEVAIMYIVDVRDAVCPTISRYVCKVISIRIKRKALTGYKMLINSCSIFGMRFQSWISSTTN